MKTPRVKFCWHCGKKLQWNASKKIFYYATLTLPDGHERIVHKQCLKTPELILTDAEILDDNLLK